ncbi:hypothetical protein [Micromonospora saelicesensis]|uniref:hypothetical protein n=1 Tax=Micromonospora saelicesensis TaxID=285676 RepID=UPI000DD5B4D0|nr:hypothetical protein [Micromonospora saelicesensis]
MQLLGLLEDEGLNDRELNEVLVADAYAADDMWHGADLQQVGAPVESDRRQANPSSTRDH